jgi:maltose O-acetyltransferase
MGSKIGANCVIHNIALFNLYRGSFSNLRIGNNCFIGDETMLDLADKITLEDWVTIAERVTILTHMNVGFREHPLQKYFPSINKPIVLKRGSFVGSSSTILAGVTMEEMSLAAAGSVITGNVPSKTVVGGVPARIIKKIE